MTRLTCLGLGAGLMYLFDPNLGPRRRALLRDQLVHWSREAEDAIEVVSRDLGNRASGIVAETTSLFSDGDAPDGTIEARVRSALGRVVSHPRAVRVAVQGGYVMLSGPVLADEVENLVETARSVRGVHGVENRLEVHQHPGGHPALQGGKPRPGVRPEWSQEHWSPTFKLLVGLTGGMLALKLMRRPALTGLAIGALGAGLAANELSKAATSGASGSGRNAPEGAGSPSMAEPWASP